MVEPGTVLLNQNFYLNKRPYDSEQPISPKRVKCDSSISDTDTESKSSIDDLEESNIDDSIISTDQSRYYPVISDSQPSFSSRSKQLIKTFHYLHDHSQRKSIEPTKSPDENFHQMKKLRISFNRIDLLKEGHTILSDQSFPFYSLCYLVRIQSSKNSSKHSFALNF
jgi:hypothetical protein